MAKNKKVKIKDIKPKDNVEKSQRIEVEVKAKHPGGRPTIYTEEVANEIIDRLTEGESMTMICKDEHMPCVTTVFMWRGQNKGFLKRYTRARKHQSEVLLDKSRTVAEEGAEYVYGIAPTVQDAAKANALANMLKLQIGRYDHLAACYNKQFAPFQNIKSKNENTNIKKENVPISERLNRIKEKAKNYIAAKDSGEAK
jgi:hypothetical protein